MTKRLVVTSFILLTLVITLLLSLSLSTMGFKVADSFIAQSTPSTDALQIIPDEDSFT